MSSLQHLSPAVNNLKKYAWLKPYQGRYDIGLCSRGASTYCIFKGNKFSYMTCMIGHFPMLDPHSGMTYLFKSAIFLISILSRLSWKPHCLISPICVIALFVLFSLLCVVFPPAPWAPHFGGFWRPINIL